MDTIYDEDLARQLQHIRDYGRPITGPMGSNAAEAVFARALLRIGVVLALLRARHSGRTHS